MNTPIHLPPDRSRPFSMYIADIEYARRQPHVFGQVPLKLQLILPHLTACPGKHPLIIFVNGGGFVSPQMYWRIPLISRLAERGYVVAVPDYRGSDRATFPANIADVRTAARYMLAHADTYSVDRNKLIFMGGSAGAYTALMAAYAGEKFDAEDDELSIPLQVDGVIDLYGPTDLSRMTDENLSELAAAASLEGRYFGIKDIRQDPQLAKESCVLTYISEEKALPPTMIAHGSADSIVSFNQSERLYAALTQAGQAVEFYCIDGAEHADCAFFSSDMMGRYDAFIKQLFLHQ